MLLECLRQLAQKLVDARAPDGRAVDANCPRHRRRFRAAGARVVGRRGATARDARGGRGSIVQSSLILVPRAFHGVNDVRLLSSNSVSRKNASLGAQKSKKKVEVLLGFEPRLSESEPLRDAFDGAF